MSYSQPQSQPTAQSPAPLTPSSHNTTTAQNGLGTTESNTAKNASINDPQSHAPDTKSNAHEGLRNPDDEITPEQAKEEGLPEQKHAGAVGYGPDFANKNRATAGDKLTGLKEELFGKIKRDPELVQKGHERRTGELKRKEHEEPEKDPFAKPEDKKPSSPDSHPDSTKAKAQPTHSSPADQKAASQSGLGGGTTNDVDLEAGKRRLTADSPHPAARSGDVQRAAEI